MAFGENQSIYNMKICSKCKVEKQLDKFQKYWHSTQQVERTRAECTECFYKLRNERRRIKRLNTNLEQVPTPIEIVQPVVTESQPDPFQNNPDYKKCNTCFEYRELDEFYYQNRKKNQRFGKCKVCQRNEDKKKAHQKVLDNSGSDRYYTKPNKYIDEHQRKGVFDVMLALGWTFNEEKGIWYKDGIKTSDGVFIKIPQPKPFSPNAPDYLKTKEKRELYHRAVELRKKNMSLLSISNKLGISHTTVFRWLKTN